MTSIAHKYDDGTIEWRNEKKRLHREDGPALEYPGGHKEWWLNGERHRKNGPAVECLDGHKEWWLNGKRHRENGPAIQYSEGSVEYWLNGDNSEEAEQKVKDNMAHIQAAEDQQELISQLSQDQDISVKIKYTSAKTSKKL